MKVGDYCKRAVVSIDGAADAIDAAKLMREEHVGLLVVYQQGDELRKPVGVLTDRDIVLEVTAREVDPRSVAVQDIMTRQPLLANDSDDLSETLQAMRTAGIRRVPVVDLRGALSGIIAIDDAIDLVTGLLYDISGSIKSEQRREWRFRPALSG
jgi:predicted transcriptional regulator